MKHKFSKKWLALLLGAVMVVAVMIPMLFVSPKAADTDTYKQIKSTSELEAGAQYLIVCEKKPAAMGEISTTNTKYGLSVSVTINATDETITDVSSDVQIVTLGGSTDQWTLKISSGYLSWSSGNSLATSSTADTTNQQWKISFDDSGNAVIQNAKDTTRKLQYNSSSPRFACYTSSQTVVQLYKLQAACTHENTEAFGESKDATCTEGGNKAGVKCSDCGEVITEPEPIEATGHIDENGDSKCDTCGTNLCTEHVWVDGEVIAEGDCTTNRVVAQVCEKCGEPGEDKVTTAPGHTPVVDEEVPATCTSIGKTEGSHCDVCDEVIVAQTDIPMLDHDYVNNVCSVCGAEKPVLPTFEKVTSNLDDFSGTYLIVYEAGEVDVAFDGKLLDLDVASNTVGVTITDGVITGDLLGSVFFIDKTANGYTIKSASELYIGSTGFSNQLLTAKTYYNTISIDANGDAVITAESGTTLRYNNTSGQYRFRYYKSGQQPVTLYKLVEAVPEPEFNGFGVTLNKGVTVRVKFTIDQAWIDANPTAKVTFSNGTVCDLVENESYYTTTLTPGKIGDDLTVTLGDITETVSVSTYIEKAKAANDTDTTLCALLDAIEVYGKAAARVEQTLTDLGLTGVEDYNVEQNESIISGFDNVTLGQYANIGIKFEKNEDYTYVAKLGDISLGRRVLANDLDTNNVLLIENLFPANFDDVITVTVYEGDTSTVVSTMTFTFNSYLKEAKDEAASDLDLNMIIATYNYGVAAEAYVDAHQQS